jgi:hypothetical protein
MKGLFVEITARNVKYQIIQLNIYYSTNPYTKTFYKIDFKQFLTCFDVCHIILTGIKLEHWGRAEASQSYKDWLASAVTSFLT